MTNSGNFNDDPSAFPNKEWTKIGSCVFIIFIGDLLLIIHAYTQSISAKLFGVTVILVGVVGSLAYGIHICASFTHPRPSDVPNNQINIPNEQEPTAYSLHSLTNQLNDPSIENMPNNLATIYNPSMPSWSLLYALPSEALYVDMPPSVDSQIISPQYSPPSYGHPPTYAEAMSTPSVEDR